MAFKLFDSKDAIPEAQRAAAIETKDGKWAAEDEAGDAGKKALDAERDARAKADKKAKDAADALRAAEKERDELKIKADAAASGVTEQKLQEIRDAEAKARKPIEDRLAAVEAENRKLKLDDKVRAIALAKGVMPDRIEKVMRDLVGRVDLTDDGAGILVKDAKGNTTAETIDDFLGASYKKEAPFFYAGTGSSGSGSEGSGGGGGGGGYDPVAAGKAAAAEQKKGSGDTKLAFT